MNIKLPAVKLPKLPTRQQIKRAMPTIMAVTSVIGNVVSVCMMVNRTIKVTRIMDEMHEEGATNKEIAKVVVPKYILPTVIFIGAQVCTIECNILNKRQQYGLATALIGADYRYRSLKSKKDDDANPDFKGNPPEIKNDEILFYDEYLETATQNGYFAMREADWYKGYGEFQELLNDPNYYCGCATYWDLYEHIWSTEDGSIAYPELVEKISNLGSWPNCAGFDMDYWGTAKILKLEDGWIDDRTPYKIIHWLCMPTVTMDSIEEGLV